MPVVTTHMTLTTWPAPTDEFDYTELADNFNAIDAHDHTPGKGTQVPTAGIANLAVTTGKLADDAVTTAKIADDAITSALIADDAVTSAHIATDAVGQAEIAASAVGATELAADAVTTVKILNGAVTTAKIASGSKLLTDFATTGAPGTANAYIEMTINTASGPQVVRIHCSTTD
jgi:hypothetical protein